jgi:hypothetical protein
MAQVSCRRGGNGDHSTQREIQLQRSRNAESSFLGGASTSETQPRRDYMNAHSERVPQAPDLQRQSLLQRECDAQSSFPLSGAPRSDF